MFSCMASLTERLKARAHEIGFDLIGVATPEPPPHLEVYERWLTRGRHGEMDYLATERARARRADPREILPGCRSIVVVAVNYYPGDEPVEPGDRLAGRVARYARGADYHDVIPAMLGQLVAFLEAEVGRSVPHKIYTDTGPLLERELAQRAGLGWIGKNTNLINPRIGSWLLLGELLLTLELTPDAPFEPDRCGGCTRCLQACPTACILPDRTLDARRCISYLTIEVKDRIAPDLRSLVGEWAFGCDICQEVCPWNVRFAPPVRVEALRPRDGQTWLDLEALLAGEDDEFRRRFRGTPLMRPGRRGLARNAAVALGNKKGAAAIPALARAMHADPDETVREHAAWALFRLQRERP